MNRSGVVALVLAKEIEIFTHKEVDSEKTLIRFKREDFDNYSLEVKLYDTYGNYIPEDHGVKPYYFAPGILFSVSNKGNSVKIERMYIKPEYGKKHIGTSLVTHLESAAQSIKVRVLFLEADEETNAKNYWQNKHNFFSPDRERPNYLEKRIN